MTGSDRPAIEIRAGKIGLPMLRRIYSEPVVLELGRQDRARIAAATALVAMGTVFPTRDGTS